MKKELPVHRYKEPDAGSQDDILDGYRTDNNFRYRGLVQLEELSRRYRKVY